MQVSTLIELARSLDLALQLVPRTALVSVEAAIRSAEDRSGERSPETFWPPCAASPSKPRRRARAGGHRLDRVDPSISRAARIGVSLARPNRRYGQAEDQSRRIADLSARVSSEPREISPRRCRVAKATQEHPDARVICGASCLTALMTRTSDGR